MENKKLALIGAIFAICLIGNFTTLAKADTRIVNLTLDTKVNSYYPSYNYDGGTYETGVRNDSSVKEWSYFMINLSSYYPESVDSANITFYKSSRAWSSVCNDANYITLGIYEVYVPFNVSELSFNSQPCGTDFDQSDNCNLTAVVLKNETCADWDSHTSFTMDITDLVAREIADDDVVRFALFPTLRNGTGTLAYGIVPTEFKLISGENPYLTIDGNFTWYVETTTTAPPDVNEPAFDWAAQAGYTGGAAIFINFFLIPAVWGVLFALIISAYIAHKLDNNQIIFLGCFSSIITILALYNILPIWVIIIEIVLAAFLFAKNFQQQFNGG